MEERSRWLDRSWKSHVHRLLFLFLAERKPLSLIYMCVCVCVLAYMCVSNKKIVWEGLDLDLSIKSIIPCALNGSRSLKVWRKMSMWDYLTLFKFFCHVFASHFTYFSIFCESIRLVPLLFDFLLFTDCIFVYAREWFTCTNRCSNHTVTCPVPTVTWTVDGFSRSLDSHYTRLGTKRAARRSVSFR